MNKALAWLTQASSLRAIFQIGTALGIVQLSDDEQDALIALCFAALGVINAFKKDVKVKDVEKIVDKKLEEATPQPQPLPWNPEGKPV
jgi:hypothetical protein